VSQFETVSIGADSRRAGVRVQQAEGHIGSRRAAPELEEAPGPCRRQGTVLRTRAADPATDAARVNAVLGRNLPPAAGAARLAWLYRSNPLGPALVWIAEEEGSGEAVATSAAHRRRFRIDGREAQVLNLSDFAIDARYRTLGPALALLRATLAGVAEGGYAFSYDVPSESMLAVYRRLGCVEVGRLERRVRPLSLGPALRRRLGRAGALVAPLADAILRLRDAFSRTPRGLDVAPLAGGFGAEFDCLEEREATRYRVRGVRSAAYLDWRYARHATLPHGTLCARRGGDLAGYLVWRRVEPGSLSVAEIAGDIDVARALVARLAKEGRSLGADSLSVQTLAGSPAAELLARLGFVKREEAPGPVVYLPPGTSLPRDLLEPRHWWFLEGDRDV
jgi:hypothetical protein